MLDYSVRCEVASLLNVCCDTAPNDVTRHNTLVSTQTLSPEVCIPNVITRKRSSLRILQPEVTHTGAPIKPLHRGLPKTTESLCPECTKVIPARVIADQGKVIMLKSCAEHGDFRDIVFSDVDL